LTLKWWEQYITDAPFIMIKSKYIVNRPFWLRHICNYNSHSLHFLLWSLSPIAWYMHALIINKLVILFLITSQFTSTRKIYRIGSVGNALFLQQPLYVLIYPIDSFSIAMMEATRWRIPGLTTGASGK